MRIGLIDVDSHNFPNLVLMKLSAWHKARGDTVEWWSGFSEYDRVYMSKIFDTTYTPDILEPVNTREIIKGGTGYVWRHEDRGLRYFFDNEWVSAEDEVFVELAAGGLTYQEALPDKVEHMYPDYSLYPKLTQETAYGFLTRGCPRGCDFCIVAGKEGRAARKVADLSEWWSGQKNIKLLDPNLLACREHMGLLKQLADSGAWVDFTQGLDTRLLTVENIRAINAVKVKEIHFAWDYMDFATNDAVLRGLWRYVENGRKNRHGQYATVYVLTNYNTAMNENLFRIYTLRDLGFDPYVMIYDKPNAPREIRLLQRWCNNRKIFRSEPDFYKFDAKKV